MYNRAVLVTLSYFEAGNVLIFYYYDWLDDDDDDGDDDDDDDDDCDCYQHARTPSVWRVVQSLTLK